MAKAPLPIEEIETEIATLKALAKKDQGASLPRLASSLIALSIEFFDRACNFGEEEKSLEMAREANMRAISSRVLKLSSQRPKLSSW